MPADADHHGQDGAHGVPADWGALPEPVRGRLVELAAASLGELSEADVPKRLRPVVRFAPAKRSRVAAAPLLASLRESRRFRAAVVAWARANRPAALDVAAEDPVTAAAAAVLLDDENSSALLTTVAERGEQASLRAERDAALARIERLEAELAEVRDELKAEREATQRARAERSDELERLRERLRERGVELRRLRDAEHEARQRFEGEGSKIAAERDELAEQLAKQRRRAEAERARAESAEADAQRARQSAREAREADEVRLALLLDTLDGAVGGLRAELNVGATAADHGRRPADTVASADNATALRPGGAVSDTAGLQRLLTLAGAHLIIDGYNVTKTGYPELVLAEQRQRLVRQLGALAARTSVEITVVFDGAGVVAVPSANVRGVRVLFSADGVPADDVITDMVTREPKGRPLIVATADREIITAVTKRSAFVLPPRVLLDELGRV
ncbi:NYN domain-containing protein [Haloechinothrix salitolerans]|uniref:NYN domain-containing protein n=1 Tax=Haloechinothrix salitolerans TaxID=926830 RepID=A0ABW2C3W3_9PSEU